MLTYYDPNTKRYHLKRRYKWAIGAFLVGFVSGITLVLLL